MAVEMTNFTSEQLDLQIDAVKYYTDSRVVLGYTQNENRDCISMLEIVWTLYVSFLYQVSGTTFLQA